MVGDNSFKIKPRLGDYVLLNRNQVSKYTRFMYNPHDLSFSMAESFIRSALLAVQ